MGGGGLVTLQRRHRRRRYRGAALQAGGAIGELVNHDQRAASGVGIGHVDPREQPPERVRKGCDRNTPEQAAFDDTTRR